MTKSAQKSVRLTSIKGAGENRAPKFDLPVTVPRTDGSVFSFTVQVKSLRRSEWTAIRDAGKLDAAEFNVDKEAEKQTFFTDLHNTLLSGGINSVLKVADGWDLEDEFSAESLQALEDVLPGSAAAILSALDGAMIGGRLGN